MTKMSTICPAQHAEPHTPHGSCQGRAPEFPSETVYNICTRGHMTTDDLVPWAGELLCWNCADAQLDLMALAMASEDGLPVTVGQGVKTPGHTVSYSTEAYRVPSQDELAEALASDLLALAGGDPRRIEHIERALGMDSTWQDEADDTELFADAAADYAEIERGTL